MKSVIHSLLVLSVLLLVLTMAKAFAGIYCNQLAACKGAAGCAGFGSVKGCTITCSDGTLVNCKHRGQGGGGDCDPYWGGDCDEEV